MRQGGVSDAKRRRLPMAALALLLGLAAPSAVIAGPAPDEVVGYAAKDGRPTGTWRLAPDKPYLLIPRLESGGALTRVEAGAEVAAVLFERPYFGARDRRCAPALGTAVRPDLKWQGPTARFVPAPPGPPGPPEAAAQSYASLIIYRRLLGPPPGVLLMERRRILGSECREPVHMTFYDRRFVPLAEPPEARACVNLVEVDADPDEQPDASFPRAEQIALLLPSDLDDRYKNLEHRFTVALFDAPGCRGSYVGFSSQYDATGSHRLAEHNIREKVRSVFLLYEGGELDAYLTPPEPAPALAQASPPPDAAPAPAAPPAPAATKAETQSAKAPSPEESEALAELVPLAAGLEPAPAEAGEPGVRIASAAVASDAGAAPQLAPQAAAPRASAEAAAPVQTRASVQQAAAAPPAGLRPPAVSKLRPETLFRSEPPDPTAASATFEFPLHEVYRLNYCLYWGRECGEPAAAAWCRARGFERASAWTVEKQIGGLFPTIVLGEKRVCAEPSCDGFRDITCAR